MRTLLTYSPTAWAEVRARAAEIYTVPIGIPEQSAVQTNQRPTDNQTPHEGVVTRLGVGDEYDVARVQPVLQPRCLSNKHTGNVQQHTK